MTRKQKRIFFVILALAAVFGAALNLDVSIRQGIEDRCQQVHMPLYVKWTQFLARHYEYARLARAITVHCKTDEEKAIAILDWTRQNIKDLPAGMPVHDDHILNIIIRGYGVPEQFQDVFTTLCVYSHIPAFWESIRVRGAKYALSFVKIDGRWRVFDAYYGKYFRTKAGAIASAEDIIGDRSIVKGPDIDSIKIKGEPYKKFYDGLKTPLIAPATLRAEKQMPVHRILFESKKVFGIEKEAAKGTDN